MKVQQFYATKAGKRGREKYKIIKWFIISKAINRSLLFLKQLIEESCSFWYLCNS